MSEKKEVSRRSFIQATAAGASTLALGISQRVLGANDEVILGMIGTGGRGQSLLKRLTRVPHVRVAALCDLREERVNQAGQIFEDAKKYIQFEELLEKEKLDGCIVATEVGNHAKCVIPVLESGLHCFSEKPMDCTVEKVDAIVKAARQAKGIYQVGFQRRYAPAFVDGIGQIHAGIIGDVTIMQGHWHWPWQVGGWVADVDMSGGEIVEQACHHMDVMSWVKQGKPPVKCVAVGHITRPNPGSNQHNSEDQSSVTFVWDDGSILSYTHLFYLADQFQSEQLVVHGKNGGVDLREGMVYPRPGKGEPQRIAEKVPDWEYGTLEELIAFADHIRKGEKSRSNQETGRVSTLMSLMARKAMYERDNKTFDPKVVSWQDLGTTT